MITSIHERMQRCLLADNGTVTDYLDPNDSHNILGTAPSITGGAGAGTAGLTLKSTGAFASGVAAGQWVKNTETGYYHEIQAVTDADTLTLYPQMGSVKKNWGQTTATTAGKVVDSGADFVSQGVLVGDYVFLRNLSAFGRVTAVTATELSVDNDIFPSGTNYSILKGWNVGDGFEVCTAVLDGSDGQVMVEIPKFYMKYTFNVGQHSWLISEQKKDGYVVHPAFLRANGSEREFIYVSAFEGAVSGDRGFANGLVLTGKNLGTDKLVSLPGRQIIVNGQRSEFRQVAGNNGSGWHQEDWYSRWAVQLLFLIEYESLDSQSALGLGLTTWSSGDRDAWCVNTSNRAAVHSGYSMKYGNASIDVDTDGGNASGVSSYRGIENFWGNIWKWTDGINVLDRRVLLCRDPASFADDTSVGYQDTGHVMPVASASYIRDIFPDHRGLIPNNVSGGSSSTYLADALWTSTAWRVVSAGGLVDSGVPAGFAALLATDGSSARLTAFGGRVCFRN